MAYKIGFIGLGQMGLPLCRRIAAKFPSTCWSKDMPQSIDFECKVTANSRETVDGADFIVTCLPNSDIVKQVYNDVENLLARDSVWIDCTSGNPSISRSLAEDSISKARHFLDCPVSGGPSGASRGTLTTMIGGDQQIFDRSKPILETFASNNVYIGPSGSGHAVKAINNALLAINIWCVGEGLMALKKLEVSPSKALEGINLSSGRSLVTMQRYPDYVIPRTFDFGFSLDLIKKDLNTACMVLKETGVAGHMMGKQLDLVKVAIEHVGPNADHLEMIKLLETWSQCKIED